MEYEMVKLSRTGKTVAELVRSREQGDMLKLHLETRQIYYIVCDNGYTGGFRFHRLDGPSQICDVVTFSINDRTHTKTEDYCRAAGMSEEDTFMWVLRFGDELPKTCKEYYGEDWRSIPVDQL